ncbi:type VII secretion-associated serine protease mycosin [Krasilnikovia sp. M28-CT-15]|uniref:type VII secretion-associated serine protease mycosin n=1 Tax=Krasilnikovia sp. M28-CT-15 TaxID=3373540 RepID=UPI00399D1831
MLAAISIVTVGSPAFADDIRDRQWHLKSLNIADVHSISTGRGVTVAVIDSGVSNHRDLSGSVLAGKDFTDSSGSGQTDTNGHGTAMAGDIAAHGKGESGALGIAPDSKILPVRVLTTGKTGRGLGPAISWAVTHGADVINISLGGGATPDLFSALEAAEKANVVVVASAGNLPESHGITSPAFVPSVVAVGAVDRDGKRASVSASGAALDLMAPGTDIMSTSVHNQYAAGTGTSDAAAIVSGAAALIRSKYPALSAREVVARLESTAIDKGAPGVDPEYGHGVIDLVAALSTDAPVATDQPSASPSPADSIPQANYSPSGDSAAASATQSSGRSSLLFGIAAMLAVLGGLAAFLILRRRRN